MNNNVTRKSRYQDTTTRLSNVQQRCNQHYVYSSPWGILTEMLKKKHTHSWTTRYGERDNERRSLKAAQRERQTRGQKQRWTKRAGASKKESGKKRDEWKQTELKVLFYLLNPPADRHQKTAYLSVTLMSSNRPGTVGNTHRTLFTCCCLCVIYLKCLWRLGSGLNLLFLWWWHWCQCVPSLTIELKECRRRMACPYRRVLCPPLCAACRDNSQTHTHIHTSA